MRKRALKRRNFLPTLFVDLLALVTLFFLVFFFAPEATLLISLFYFLAFIFFFLTFSLLLANSRRGFLFSLAFIGFLFLKQIKQDNWLNLVLLASILLSIELYFWQK